MEGDRRKEKRKERRIREKNMKTEKNENKKGVCDPPRISPLSNRDSQLLCCLPLSCVSLVSKICKLPSNHSIHIL
jgi:hypothetical protein